MKLKLKFVIK